LLSVGLIPSHEVCGGIIHFLQIDGGTTFTEPSAIINGAVEGQEGVRRLLFPAMKKLAAYIHNGSSS